MGKTTQTLSLLFMLACPQAERSLPPFLADSLLISPTKKAAIEEPDRRYREKQNGSSYAFSFSTGNATKQLPFQLPSLVFLFLTLP